MLIIKLASVHHAAFYVNNDCSGITKDTQMKAIESKLWLYLVLAMLTHITSTAFVIPVMMIKYILSLSKSY